MTNYAGLEPLREEVAARVNDIYELLSRLKALESPKHHDAETVAELLARNAIGRIRDLYMEAYREALVLDACFKD